MPSDRGISLIVSWADYWKSQARKYCDFCKCWIADNKPTIQYHENGKRHKETVAKRISEMAKKSAKQHKENAKLDDEMKKMEEEAMKAYMKDIQSNADFTSMKLKEKLSDGGREEEENEGEARMVKPKEKKMVQEKKMLQEMKMVSEKKKVEEVKKKAWYEGKSEEGYTYYWNLNTSESRWEVPEEGYVTLAEQERSSSAQARLVEAEKQALDNAVREKAEELRAFKQRESMKRFRKVEEKKEEEVEVGDPASRGGPVVAGPRPRVDPYGAWTTVQYTEPKHIDLQLPVQPAPINFPVVTVDEPRFVIKEKKLTSLDLGEEDGDYGQTVVAFKKRKMVNQRAHMRRRVDPDEDNDHEDQENED